MDTEEKLVLASLFFSGCSLLLALTVFLSGCASREIKFDGEYSELDGMKVEKRFFVLWEKCKSQGYSNVRFEYLDEKLIGAKCER